MFKHSELIQEITTLRQRNLALFAEVEKLSMRNNEIVQDMEYYRAECERLQDPEEYREPQLSRVFLSFPKSGRTWVRAFLVSYFELLGVSQPAIFWTHGVKQGSDLTFNNPEAGRRIVLVRNPYDVMVSNYIHQTSRKPFKFESILDFLQAPLPLPFGLTAFNGKLRMWSQYEEKQLVVVYEDLFGGQMWERILGHFEMPVDEAAIAEAHEACEITTLRADLKRFEKRPDAWVFLAKENGVLTTEPENNDTHKFRRGKVGGYVDYLNQEEIQYITDNFAWEAAERLTEKAKEWRHE